MSPELRSKIIGLLFTAGSGASFAFASLFVKLCGDIPVPFLILVRAIVQVIYLLFSSDYLKGSIAVEQFK